MNSSTVTLPALAKSNSGVESKTVAKSRLSSIDTVRGFVIILMALDHVRDYVSIAHQGLLDPTVTTVGVYLTRWITHLCAPTFILLTGVSAYLTSKRCTTGELRRFLVTRGLWIIFLETTVVVFAWTFSLHYPLGLFLQVMWAIGASMIVLATVVSLSPATVGAIGLFIIATHNLLDGISPSTFGTWAPLWNLLHVRGIVPFGIASYPIIPWIGVMMLGFGVGRFFDNDSATRRRLFAGFGLCSIAGFFLLRSIDVYGDPHPWRRYDTAIKTAMSYFDVEKYPPSLLYLLMFLGIAFLLLALFETSRPWLRKASALTMFGRVPLFFYVIHLFAVHLLAGLLGWSLGFGDAVFANSFKTLPDAWGLSLPWVYLAWLAIVVIMYPLCRWFADIKRSRTEWWWSYL